MKRVREDGLAKPRALTPTVRRLIVHRATTQRQVPRDYLANELITEITQAGEKPPTLDTLKRYISKARNAHNPLDEPWTLASCSQYPAFFPPQSIPTIVRYKDYLAQVESEDPIDYKQFLRHPVSAISIRCAIWIVRLQPIIEDLSEKLTIHGEPPPPTFPLFMAAIYEMAEMTSQILGEDHFDSYDLDNALFAADMRALDQIAARTFLATTKPCHNNNDCDSCDYVKLPGFKRICVPKRKEASK